MLRTFLGLAYAELKVNFVEGFAVLCASHVYRFLHCAVFGLKPFECFAFLKKRNVVLNLFLHLIPLFLFQGLP